MENGITMEKYIDVLSDKIRTEKAIESSKHIPKYKEGELVTEKISVKQSGRLLRMLESVEKELRARFLNYDFMANANKNMERFLEASGYSQEQILKVSNGVLIQPIPIDNLMGSLMPGMTLNYSGNNILSTNPCRGLDQYDRFSIECDSVIWNEPEYKEYALEIKNGKNTYMIKGEDAGNGNVKILDIQKTNLISELVNIQPKKQSVISSFLDEQNAQSTQKQGL